MKKLTQSITNCTFKYSDRPLILWFSHTPESRLLPLVVVINDPVGDHFEGFCCDGRDVLKLQLLHRVAARTL